MFVLSLKSCFLSQFGLSCQQLNCLCGSSILWYFGNIILRRKSLRKVKLIKIDACALLNDLCEELVINLVLCLSLISHRGSSVGRKFESC